MNSDSINKSGLSGNKKRAAILKDFAVLYSDGWRPLRFEALQTKAPEPIGVMFLKHIKRPGSVFTSVIHECDDRWVYGIPEFAWKEK